MHLVLLTGTRYLTPARKKSLCCMSNVEPRQQIPFRNIFGGKCSCTQERDRIGGAEVERVVMGHYANHSLGNETSSSLRHLLLRVLPSCAHWSHEWSKQRAPTHVSGVVSMHSEPLLCLIQPVVAISVSLKSFLAINLGWRHSPCPPGRHPESFCWGSNRTQAPNRHSIAANAMMI